MRNQIKVKASLVTVLLPELGSETLTINLCRNSPLEQRSPNGLIDIWGPITRRDSSCHILQRVIAASMHT